MPDSLHGAVLFSLIYKITSVVRSQTSWFFSRRLEHSLAVRVHWNRLDPTVNSDDMWERKAGSSGRWRGITLIRIMHFC
jgi:hypothetical protein